MPQTVDEGTPLLQLQLFTTIPEGSNGHHNHDNGGDLTEVSETSTSARTSLDTSLRSHATRFSANMRQLSSRFTEMVRHHTGRLLYGMCFVVVVVCESVLYDT